MLQKDHVGSDSNSDKASVKLRPYVRGETGRDFFERQPRMSVENWDDALSSWEVHFSDMSIYWTPKEQHKHAIQSLQDIDKFRGNNWFLQNVLDNWEIKISAVLKQAKEV